MSSVSQIITFRKGRAFTTRKPVPPPAPPAPPAPPSAKVTLGGSAGAGAALTYAALAQRPAKPVEIDTRPPGPEEAAAARTPAPRPELGSAPPPPAPRPRDEREPR